MKELLNQYGGMAISSMMVIFLIALLIKLPLYQGKSLQMLTGEILKMEQQDKLTDDPKEGYVQYKSVSNPTVSLTKSTIYAGTTWYYSNLFPARDAFGKPIQVTAVSRENLSGTDRVVFPRAGIYHFEVVAKDAMGRETRGSFQVPVLQIP